MITADVIHGFVGALLGKKYDGATPTPKFHMELWDLFTSKHKFVAAAAPRGHGKSTAITLAYILANVLFRERRFVIIVSDTEGQSQNFLGDIKLELKENDDLRDLFKVKDFIKDSETDIIVQFEDGYTFRIMAKGAEQRLRGTKWNNLRPDLIVCDDLEDDEAVYNKDRREKLKRWFYGALIPSLSKDGIVRVVGTILHLDSLLNSIMPEESLKSTTVEPLRTYNFVHRGQWKAVRYRAHSEDYSLILWPTRYDKDYFVALREDFVSRGLSDVYAQEYLNYPIDETISYFKRSDFIEQTENDKEKRKRYYVGLDLAVSKESRRDYSVLVIAGIDENGILHIEDIRRGRWDSLEIVDEMFAVNKKYDPEFFVVEKGLIEKSISPFLNAEMLKRNSYLNIIKKPAVKDKMQRARGIQARLRAGGVRFAKEEDWYLDLEEEMIRFPKSKHDDQVDAISWIGLALDEFQEASTDEEVEDEEYMEWASMAEYSGRNDITGY